MKTSTILKGKYITTNSITLKNIKEIIIFSQTRNNWGQIKVCQKWLGKVPNEAKNMYNIETNIE